MRYPNILMAFCLLLLCCPSSAQTFTSIYETPNGTTHYFRNMIPYKDEGYIFITDHFFYRIDKQGKVVVQLNLGQQGAGLQHIASWKNESFLLVGGIYGGTDPVVRIYQITKDGSILQQKDITVNGSFSLAQLVAGTSDNFYLVFKHSTPKDSHVDVYGFDKNLNLRWTKEMGDEMYNEVQAIPAQNGNLEILYQSKTNASVKHLTIEPLAGMSERLLPYQPPANMEGAIRKVTRTEDGGYLYSGLERGQLKNENIVLIKTSANGNIQWEKRLDIFLGERCEELLPVQDGYLLMTMAGITREDQLYDKIDIGLVKIDLLGNPVWVQTYGSDHFDYARSMLRDKDGNILIGAQSTVVQSLTTAPVIIKTDPNGKLSQGQFSQQLFTPYFLSLMNHGKDSPVKRLANAALLADGGMLVFNNQLQQETDIFQPVLNRSNKEGNTIWSKSAPGGSEICLMRKTPDDHCVTLSSQKAFLATSEFTLTKWDPNGNILWSKQLYTTVIKDLIITEDGGFLLTGGEAEGRGSAVIKLLVIKLNGLGEPVWTFTHRLDNKWITGRSMQLSPEKDIVIAGSMQDAQLATSASFIARISASGQLKWIQSFPEGSHITSTPSKILVTRDNEYLVTGYVKELDLNKQDMLLLKTTNTGSLQWKKRIHIDKMDAGTTLLESGNGYIVAGTAGHQGFGIRENFGFILSTDKNGQQTGLQCFGEPGLTSTCTDLYAIGEQMLMVTGTRQIEYGQERPYFAIFDKTKIPRSAPVQEGVRVYPLPAHRNFWVEVVNEYQGDIRLSIYGISGQKHFQTTVTKNHSSIKIPIYVHALAAGNYFLELIMGKERVVRKLQTVAPK